MLIFKKLFEQKSRQKNRIKKEKKIENEREKSKITRGKEKDNMVIVALSTWTRRFRNHLASSFNVVYIKCN